MKFRLKPIEVDAIQFTADLANGDKGCLPSEIFYDEEIDTFLVHMPGEEIHNVQLDVGDWIVTEPDGQRYVLCDKLFFSFFEAKNESSK